MTGIFIYMNQSLSWKRLISSFCLKNDQNLDFSKQYPYVRDLKGMMEGQQHEDSTKDNNIQTI